MPRRFNNSHGARTHLLGPHPNAQNQVPGKLPLNQKFGLFILLALLPLFSLYRFPVDLSQICQITPVFEVERTSV